MPVRLNPCFGCPLRSGCELRDEWRRKVSGLGLRSATFRCPKLSAEIRPGRRIEIEVPYVAEIWRHSEDEVRERMGRKSVRATITIAMDDGRFCCTVDPGQIDEDIVPDGTDINRIRFRKPLRPQRIRCLLAGPDWPVCKTGARVKDGDSCDRPPDEPCHCKETHEFVDETEELSA